MSLPKELLDALKQDKKMLAKKLRELKDKLSETLKSSDKNAKDNTKDIVGAVKATIEPEGTTTAFDSIIAQGKLAEEDVKIKQEAVELEKNLAASRKSLSADEIAATEEHIALLKSDKLGSLEAKKEARRMSEESNDALRSIAENQSDLIKEFKSGFSELRGEGIGGLVKMLLVGIPALLGGIVAGVAAQITAVLSKFKSFALIFTKIGKFFAPMLSALSGGAGAIGGFLKALPMIGKFFQGLFIYASKAFALGKTISALAGPIGLAITIITGLIGGIRGAFKGFKEDGIIGMFREGIIGVFNALIGGLVKMVGSLIGGIFKLLGFEKIGEGIKNGFSDFIDGIVGIFRGTFNMIAGLLTLDFARVKEGIGQLLDGVINGLMGIVKGIGGIILGAFLLIPKLIFGYLKFVYITLPLKIIEFIGAAVGFIIEAFKAAFEGIKFVIFKLPGLLIDKVTAFFTSMVESIGDAFSSAFDFVKRIGAASKAALKAALPGGESPKEAFMRVMGGEGGEKEEKENLKKMQTSPAEKIKEKFKEKFLPKIKPKQKETAADFETRMMSTVNGDTPPMATVNGDTPPMAMAATETGVQSFSSEGLSSDTDVAGTELKKPVEDNSLFGKIKGIGNMMKDIVSAPFKLLGKVKDSVLGMAGEGVDKVKGIAGGFKAGFKKLFGIGGGGGMTPVLGGKNTSGDAKVDYKTALRKNLKTEAELKSFEGGLEEGKDFTMVERALRPGESISFDPVTYEQETPMERKYANPETENKLKQLENANRAAGRNVNEREKDMLVQEGALRPQLRNSRNGKTIQFARTRYQQRKGIDASSFDRGLKGDIAKNILNDESIVANPQSPAASIAAAPKKSLFTNLLKKAGNFAKKAASFTPPGLLLKGASKLRGAELKTSPKEKFKELFLGGGGGRSGPELSMSQKENAELKGESKDVGVGAVIAPNTVNNSKSSVSNTTIAAPAHIDKTQNLFGATALSW